MDLFSTIVLFRSRQNISNLMYTGRQVQAWFLQEIHRHDSSLAAQLHNTECNLSNGTQILRPYTLSALYKGPYLPKELHDGDWCWVRITSLTKELSNFISEEVLPSLLPIARIGQCEFDVQAWKIDKSSGIWQGEETYSSLKKKSLEISDTRLNFEFSSPTSFREKNQQSSLQKDVPLPLPDRVFGNYAAHWSAFSGIKLPDKMGEFIEESLVINELRIKTERVQFTAKEARRSATGFIGQVRYAILGNKKASQFGADWEDYVRNIQMLALYSFYCGSGHHTTMGLGQTQFLPKKN